MYVYREPDGVVAAVREEGGKHSHRVNFKSSAQVDPAQHDTVLGEESSTSTGATRINMRAHERAQVAARHHGGRCTHGPTHAATHSLQLAASCCSNSELVGMQWPHSVLRVLDRGPRLTAVRQSILKKTRTHILRIRSCTFSEGLGGPFTLRRGSCDSVRSAALAARCVVYEP